MFLAVIFLLVAIGLFFAAKRQQQKTIQFRVLPWVFFILGLGITLFKSAIVIEPGHVGVQIFFGNVLGQTLQNGLHLINPFVDVEQMDVKTQAYTMSGKEMEGLVRGDDAIETLSSDGLTLRLEVTVQYRLSAADAAIVYKTIGKDYVDKVVRPEIRSAIRDGAVNYVATDLYGSRREEFVLKVRNRVDAAFKARGIALENVLLRDVELPQRVKEAINDKIAAEQASQQMVYVLTKEKQEAERKRVEAAGIADAQKIISTSLSSQYLQYNYIQALKSLAGSNNSTFVITPIDQKLTPLINVAK